MKHLKDSEESLPKEPDLYDLIKQCEEDEKRDRKRKEETLRQIEKYIF